MELKQAKQHSQDLHRTSDFFGTLLTLGPSEELPKPPPEVSEIPAEEPQTNGVPPPVQVDAISPFSQPPAPPPQQPLPEKPDMPRYNIADSIPLYSLKRSNTEKPASGVSSPTKSQHPSSQILSLVEALSTAKREIDSQGDRVKHLEVLLRRERKARETAEERARSLLEGRHPPPDGSQEQPPAEEAILDLHVDSPEQAKRHLANEGDAEHEDKASPNAPMSPAKTVGSTSNNTEKSQRDAESIDASTSRLQKKLDLMVKEMDDMRLAMEGYKRRAEGAELERKGLVEMVERIRASDSNASSDSSATAAKASNNDISLQSSTTTKSSTHSTSPDRKASAPSPPSTAAPQRPQSESSGDLATKDITDLHRTLSTALQAQRWGSEGSGELAMQSAPYVSMVGVVLIGVGIMTWLNGWQKMER